MSPLPELRIGIVGYGVMGKAHSYGYRAAPSFALLPVAPVLKVLSGRDEAGVAARRVGLPGPGLDVLGEEEIA